MKEFGLIAIAIAISVLSLNVSIASVRIAKAINNISVCTLEDMGQ